VGDKSGLCSLIQPEAERYEATLALPNGEISTTMIEEIIADASYDGRQLWDVLTLVFVGLARALSDIRSRCVLRLQSESLRVPMGIRSTNRPFKNAALIGSMLAINGRYGSISQVFGSN
jgi:hypothetical protein